MDGMIPAKGSNTERAVEQLRYGGPSPDYKTYDKGVEYAIAGNFVKAQVEFNKISKSNLLYPSATSSNKVIQDAISNEDLRKSIIEFFKAHSSHHKKQYNLAILGYDKSIKLSPQYAKTYYHQGMLFSLTRQKNRAMANFNKAIELDPKFGDVYSSRGRIYMDEKKDDLAISDFSKAIELSNDPYAYMNRAQIYIGKGKYPEAVDDANMMISVNSKNPIGYNILGYIDVKLNNKAQACVNYKKACELGSCDGLIEKEQSGYCS